MLHIHRNWNAKKVLKKKEKSETFFLAITHLIFLFTGYNFLVLQLLMLIWLIFYINIYMEDGDAVTNFDME